MWKTERKAVRWVLRTGGGYLPLCLFCQNVASGLSYDQIRVEEALSQVDFGERHRKLPLPGRFIRIPYCWCWMSQRRRWM